MDKKAWVFLGLVTVCITIISCLAIWQYHVTQRECVKNGYTQQTLQGTAGGYWVKEKGE